MQPVNDLMWSSFVCLFVSNAGCQPWRSLHMKTGFALATAFRTCVLYTLVRSPAQMAAAIRLQGYSSLYCKSQQLKHEPYT